MCNIGMLLRQHEGGMRRIACGWRVVAVPAGGGRQVEGGDCEAVNAHVVAWVLVRGEMAESCARKLGT